MLNLNLIAFFLLLMQIVYAVPSVYIAHNLETSEVLNNEKSALWKTLNQLSVDSSESNVQWNPVIATTTPSTSTSRPPATRWPEIQERDLSRHHEAGHYGHSHEDDPKDGDDHYHKRELVYDNHIPVKAWRKHYRHERASKSCAAPNGLGLGQLLREAQAILPLVKIQQILADSLAHDPQVQALKALELSGNLPAKLIAIRQSLDYNLLRGYACEVLHLDLLELLRFEITFLDLTGNLKPTAGEFKGRPGIMGLLQDIHDVLPIQELQDLYQRQMEKDPYLVSAVRALRSIGFRQLLKNMENVPEYREVRQQLIKVGVPLLDFKELVDAALGWSGNEFVNEDGQII